MTVTVKDAKRSENATARGVRQCMMNNIYGDRLIRETTLEETRIFAR